MNNTAKLSIDFDQLLYSLFCAYTFSMPFELILEVLFGIDTIFKPFRILSLLIIGVFVLKVLRTGLYLDKSERTDWFLYGIFIYGIFISCFRMIGGVFSMSLFFNDLFQSGLHVTCYFVFKSVPISKKQAIKLFNFFIAGISINALYIAYQFLFNLQSGRESGFTDNPNYVALSLVGVSTFLILKINFIQKIRKQILYGFWILFLLYIFGVEGSRTGLVILLIANVFIFFFLNFRKKLMLLFGSALIVLFLIAIQSKATTIRGPQALIHRMNRTIGGEEDVRFVVWRGMFDMFEDTGYLGMGIGQFKANFPNYFGAETHKIILEMVNRGYYLSAHNDYLAILADYGLPSLILYISFLVVTLWKKILRLIYPQEGEDAKLLIQFSFVFFICIIVFGLTSGNFQHQLYWFLLMFTTKNFNANK